MGLMVITVLVKIRCDLLRSLQVYEAAAVVYDYVGYLDLKMMDGFRNVLRHKFTLTSSLKMRKNGVVLG